ncbi:MAG: IS4 family transposase [Chlamydiales bacterium]
MDFKQKHKATQVKNHKQALVNGKTDISLTAILSSESCQHILSECREFRDRIYTPVKTVFTFIKQVLNPDKSLKKAVAGVVVEQISAGKEKVSGNTGPYSKARKRLPEKAVKELVKEIGKSPTKAAPKGWKPYGRELKSFDGTTVKMADTKANQQDFPQHKNQKKGAGFPLARLVAVMSLTVGTVLNYAVDAYKGKGTGESSLLRSIFDSIEKDDIVLGDRYFPNFFLMSDLNKRGADGIFRGQSQRNYDFRTGERLGKNDHIVFWNRPAKPEWMDQEKYDSYPEKMQVREFKVAGNVYVTTFLNSKKYHKKELAGIYGRRWDIEINLRSIKSIMNMDMLSCKTPEMVKKEIGMHFLAYNSIRIIMAEACVMHNTVPWRVSFKGTIQLLNEFMPHFLNSGNRKNKILYAEMLTLIVKNKIGNRPGRVEPRVIKQRKKPFPTLNNPRIVEKEKLMRKIKKMISRHAEA